jgi:hypothetical protein
VCESGDFTDGSDKTCAAWRQLQTVRAFAVSHLILIGLAAVALAGMGHNFAAFKGLAVATSAFAWITGVIAMAVFIRFKRDLTDYKEGSFEADVTYENGIKLHTTAWAVSLVAFLFVLLAKKPSAAAELAADAAGAV